MKQARLASDGRTRRAAARLVLVGALLAVLLALDVAPVLAASSTPTSKPTATAAATTTATPTATLTPPATIKVARRFPANDPHGVIVGVDTVDFRTYCVRVLSHEWAPPGAFSDEALRAGALAVREYAWYWATRPTKLPDVAAWGANVDDTTNYQVYMDWDYGQRYWDAVNSTWGTSMIRGGQIFQASYYAGAYSGAATDGYHMTQWGSQYWAAQGKDHLWIAEYYYPGTQFVGAVGAVAAPATSASSAPWTGPDAPKGAAKLDVIGPVQLSPGPYRKGQTLKANFTLRNDGARTGTWAIVTLVARGPQNQERDLGSATNVTLKPGAYRLFTGRVKLDLAGRWHGWLIVGDGSRLTLLDGGAPFAFSVAGKTGAAATGAAASPASQAQSRLSVGQ
ncbi:MAG: SpoIID/LytB domain-containing protein, partial [Thermoleophilia bacterium]